jgi:hypothetical protein
MLMEIFNILSICKSNLTLHFQIKASIGIKVCQQFLHTHPFYSLHSYNSGFPGNNSRAEFQASGAYIFRPLAQTPQPVSAARTM